MDSDDPPDSKTLIQQGKAVIYDSEKVPYFTLPSDQITPSVIARIYRHKCNGNKPKVEDLLGRFNTLGGHPIKIVAERDGGERYETMGILCPELACQGREDKTPSAIILTRQSQKIDEYEIVFFDRIRSACPWGKHS